MADGVLVGLATAGVAALLTAMLVDDSESWFPAEIAAGTVVATFAVPLGVLIGLTRGHTTTYEVR